jgi:hypothetical protein
MPVSSVTENWTLNAQGRSQVRDPVIRKLFKISISVSPVWPKNDAFVYFKITEFTYTNMWWADNRTKRKYTSVTALPAAHNVIVYFVSAFSGHPLSKFFFSIWMKINTCQFIWVIQSVINRKSQLSPSRDAFQNHLLLPSANNSAQH